MQNTHYIAHLADQQGHISYSDDDDLIWAELMDRQLDLLPNRAHQDWIDALTRLELPHDRIPQCAEVSEVLGDHTGWQVEPVPALIPFTRFFELLAHKRFPAASFIRNREELDYVTEPDIFHEIFGHAPLLTDPRFAGFTHAFGQAGLAAPSTNHALLARLYWFTVEFGLIQTDQGLRSYGAGINSSPGELEYALTSDTPRRVPFDPLAVLRTNYRIDVFQTNYFVLDRFDQLFDMAYMDLNGLVAKARRMGPSSLTAMPQKSVAC